MQTDIYHKVIGVAIAFSILFFSFHHTFYSLANFFRTATLILLILCFILIWMKTKKMHYFLSSMVLPFWMMLLIQPSLITRQLDFIQKEEQLQKLALLIQAEGTYQLLSNYKLMDLNRALNLDTAKQIQALLRETAVDSFQLGHGCISFYLKTVSIRYYYHKNSLPYAGDQKIKDQWYWLDTSP